MASYGGKLRRVERQIHHYGSGLNSQPLLSQWRKTPTDTYLLRVGFGGNSGPLSNIDQAGFASASFHSWPDTLKWDGYSGDYGPGFVGLALNSGVYIAQDSSKGTLVFGGDQADNGAITPRDASRKRVFVGSMGVGIEIDAGAITQVTVSGSTVTLTVSQGLSGEPAATAAIVWVDNYTGGSYKVTSGGTSARGGTSVTLSSSGTTITVG